MGQKSAWVVAFGTFLIGLLSGMYALAAKIDDKLVPVNIKIDQLANAVDTRIEAQISPLRTDIREIRGLMIKIYERGVK